jgi:hypothetical protein
MSDFSVAQETALLALASGAHVIEAAEAAGVVRETVSRWKSQPAFAEELRRRRDRLWAEHEDRLIKMVAECLDGLYVLTHGPEYVGAEHYDPRVRLDAIKLVLLISGLTPSQPALTINNLLAAQQVNK